MPTQDFGGALSLARERFRKATFITRIRNDRQGETSRGRTEWRSFPVRRVEQYVTLPTPRGKRGRTVVYSEGDTGLQGAGAAVTTTVGVAGVAAVGSVGATDRRHGPSRPTVQFDPAARVVISTALRNR